LAFGRKSTPGKEDKLPERETKTKMDPSKKGNRGVAKEGGGVREKQKSVSAEGKKSRGGVEWLQKKYGAGRTEAMGFNERGRNRREVPKWRKKKGGGGTANPPKKTKRGKNGAGRGPKGRKDAQ